jgi:hypothetical protein
MRSQLQYEGFGKEEEERDNRDDYDFANPKAWQKPKPKPGRLVL